MKHLALVDAGGGIGVKLVPIRSNINMPKTGIFIYLEHNTCGRRVKLQTSCSLTLFAFTTLGVTSDLAVGAPCDDRGKVYIFLGNQDSISQKPSQVVTFLNSFIASVGVGLFDFSL